MEERGLILSHMTPDSKAGMGKRVFEITDAGRDCMRNWVETLEQYRRGIDQVIVHLREALPDDRQVQKKETSCCCCEKPAEE